jgi:hypothetical protein
MPRQELIQPEFNKKGFTCPHCNYNSQHNWMSHYFHDKNKRSTDFVYTVECQHCNRFSIWYEEKMIYPEVVSVDDPNEDIPENVKIDYIEASLIVEKSPRAAAALLRLSTEKLCIFLGENGKTDSMIANLVKKGLPTQVQQSLDIVRVIGNEEVHAGQIDLKDDKATVFKLFKLVNFICEKMITEPKYIEYNFNKLPQNKIEGIQNRDQS